MKILYHHRIASRDGQYIHLRAIVNQLRKLDQDVLLVGPELSESSGMGGERAWVRVLKQAIPQMLYEIIEFGYNVYDFIKLSKAILTYKPDVIYERANLFFISGIWAAKLFGLPLLLEVNAPIYQERKRYNSIVLDGLALWTEKYVWKQADCILPVTHVLADMVKEHVTPKAIEVIPNGIDPAELIPDVERHVMLEQLGLKGKTIIGFVGFVRDWHKLERIISYIAASENTHLTLLIVGEGPDCERLEHISKSLNVANQVVFTGVVQRDDMANYINIFDIALQPAVTEYASPLKLFEYLYLGCAIIAPDSKNIREVLVNNENAIFFEDSQESINQALTAVLDKDKRMKLQKNAHETIIKHDFLWSENAKKIISLFKYYKT